MKHFYPNIFAGRLLRNRLPGVMRGGLVLTLSALLLPAAAEASETNGGTTAGTTQTDGRGGGKSAMPYPASLKMRTAMQ